MGLQALGLLVICPLNLDVLYKGQSFSHVFSLTDVPLVWVPGHGSLVPFPLFPGQLYLLGLGEAIDVFPFAQVWSGLLPWYLSGQAEGLHQ